MFGFDCLVVMSRAPGNSMTNILENKIKLEYVINLTAGCWNTNQSSLVVETCSSGQILFQSSRVEKYNNDTDLASHNKGKCRIYNRRVSVTV